ncbi:MAG: ankyrin repeat domain-containing protein [Verrucomicrobiales bacterium]|nr:ankyrin repeat domain-containing protein [Verrucomicrobiales bacterium]
MSDSIRAREIRDAIGRRYEDDPRVLSLLGNDLELSDSSGRTPLHHAVIHGRGSLVRKLIALGATPAPQDSEGRTPLHFAVQNRIIDAAKLLLEAGATVDAKDAHGNTPLWGAVMQFRDYEETIDLLVSYGASPDSKNNYGKSPRDLALSMKGGEATEMLNRSCNR